ncbi:MAG: YbhN family protein [Flavobacteriales bacterium]
MSRVLIPLAIGLGVALWMLISSLNETRFEKCPDHTCDYIWEDNNNNGEVDFTHRLEFVATQSNSIHTETYRKLTYGEMLKNVDWTWKSTFWMLIALLMVAVRDLGYMLRIRLLTDRQLSWRQSFDVIMLWEFASALTPSVVGGAGIAVFIVNREGINMGKSTAAVLITALMDELFYLITVPLVILVVGMSDIFPPAEARMVFGYELNIQTIFLVGYFFMVLLTCFILFGVFFSPQGFKKIMLLFTKFPGLRRFRERAAKTGDEIIIASGEYKRKNLLFWVKCFAYTFFSWTARFWVVNFLILAVTSVGMLDNFLIYARQLIMWVIMLISPTPGGSGVAEYAFTTFLNDFLPQGALMGITLAIIWRLYSYFPYLFIGSVILPRWLKKTGEKIKERKAQETPN